MSPFAFYSVVLALVLAGVIVPIIACVRAVSRRRAAIANGTLVLVDRTSAIASVSLIAVFFGALPGIVLAHIALARLKLTRERGWGLAIAALWIGYAAVASAVLLWVLVVLASAVVSY